MTISYFCVVLGQVIAPFVVLMLPQLFALLPNSAKVMATSAEVCVKFIIKVSRMVCKVLLLVNRYNYIAALALTENF